MMKFHASFGFFSREYWTVELLIFDTPSDAEFKKLPALAKAALAVSCFAIFTGFFCSVEERPSHHASTWPCAFPTLMIPESIFCCHTSVGKSSDIFKFPLV